MLKEQNDQRTVLPIAYFIPLIPLLVACTVSIAAIVAIVSRYPGLVELELKSGVNSGAITIDGRSPSIALPPGKQ